MNGFGGWGWGNGQDLPTGEIEEEAEAMVAPGKLEKVWDFITEAAIGVPSLMLSDFKELVSRIGG